VKYFYGISIVLKNLAFIGICDVYGRVFTGSYVIETGSSFDHHFIYYDTFIDVNQCQFIKISNEKDIIDIRNIIGAHRGNHLWVDIMEFWDKLEPETFRPLFNTIPELFEALIKLDIYDWTRIPEEGSIEICCSALNQP